MNINQKIQEFLTEHQYQKKRRIFTAVLSLMIVFSVVSSLIMPAISMTMQDLDDAAAVDTIDAESGDENIMLLGESAPIDLITSSSTHEITITDNKSSRSARALAICPDGKLLVQETDGTQSKLAFGEISIKIPPIK